MPQQGHAAEHYGCACTELYSAEILLEFIACRTCII